MTQHDHKHVTAMSVKMYAVATLKNDGCITGELDCKYFEEPFSFNSLVGMIEIMETTFDTKGFPEKHLLPRTFGKAKRRFRKHELDLNAIARERSFTNNMIDSQSNKNAYAKTCNFEISVRFRHNAEWQGTIKWLEKDVTKRFSSIIEFARQINAALAE